MVRIASAPYKPSKTIQLISFDLKISNPSKNTITKAMDIEPDNITPNVPVVSLSNVPPVSFTNVPLINTFAEL